MEPEQHGPELPSLEGAVILDVKTKRPKSQPKQIRPYDNRDDRTVIHRLLSKLPPRKRVAFHEWVCSNTYLPASRIHPRVAPSTYALAETAMRCDAADGRLTMEIFLDMTHLAVDWAMALDKILLLLEETVRKQT